MKKLFKILLILLLITILGVGGLFTYLKFFKEKEPTEPKVEITYNEDVGSLITTLTQIEQTVSSENSLTLTKSNEKIIVKTMNDGFKNVESEIIYVTTFNNTNKSLLPYIEKYFNVDETYLILADIDNRLVNDSFIFFATLVVSFCSRGFVFIGISSGIFFTSQMIVYISGFFSPSFSELM